MSFTMSKVASLYSIMQDLSKHKSPMKVTYWLTVNTKRIKPAFEFYISERDKLYSDILYKNEDGTIVTKQTDGTWTFNIPENRKTEWVTRLNELNNLPADFTPYILNLEKVSKENPEWYIEPMYMMELIDLMDVDVKDE